LLLEAKYLIRFGFYLRVTIRGTVPLGFTFRPTHDGAQIGRAIATEDFDREITDFVEEIDRHPYTEPNFPEIAPERLNP
jgi:hypothetical protein